VNEVMQSTVRTNTAISEERKKELDSHKPSRAAISKAQSEAQSSSHFEATAEETS